MASRKPARCNVMCEETDKVGVTLVRMPLLRRNRNYTRDLIGAGPRHLTGSL